MRLRLLPPSVIIAAFVLALVSYPVLATPGAAPTPPFISIERAGPTSAALLWEHSDQTITQYQIWRAANLPYFDPPGQGVQIDSYTFPTGLYGVGAQFRYVDDGVCGYFTAPPGAPGCRTTQNPQVQVIGNVNINYFWVVRAGNSGNEFAFENRVGEFDYALTKGT